MAYLLIGALLLGIGAALGAILAEVSNARAKTDPEQPGTSDHEGFDLRTLRGTSTLRCSTCGESWPAVVEFNRCPRCGEPTDPIINDRPTATIAEALWALKRRRFGEYLDATGRR